MKKVKRACILPVVAVMQFAHRRRGLWQSVVELAGFGTAVAGISFLPFVGDALALMAGGIVIVVYAQGISDGDS